jgi:ubiquitin-conjugating enzyme E2 Q
VGDGLRLDALVLSSCTGHSRYLLVKSSFQYGSSSPEQSKSSNIPFVKLDPKFKVTIGQKQINIPEPTYKLDILVQARRSEIDGMIDLNDEDDVSVFEHGALPQSSAQEGTKGQPVAISDDEDDDPDDYDESWAYEDDTPAAGPSTTSRAQRLAPTTVPKPPVNDWKHDPEWVRQTVEHLIVPPTESSPMAIKSIQRELKAMLAEQKKAASLKELGWYLPPEYVENNDNLFQWIVGA